MLAFWSSARSSQANTQVNLHWSSIWRRHLVPVERFNFTSLKGFSAKFSFFMLCTPTGSDFRDVWEIRFQRPFHDIVAIYFIFFHYPPFWTIESKPRIMFSLHLKFSNRSVFAVPSFSCSFMFLPRLDDRNRSLKFILSPFIYAFGYIPKFDFSFDAMICCLNSAATKNLFQLQDFGTSKIVCGVYALLVKFILFWNLRPHTQLWVKKKIG